MVDNKRLYRVSFINQGQCYEIYARHVTQGGLFGFIEIEDLVFGARTQIVVDPTEEKLQKEFEGVKRFFVPMHSVVRIDEVEKEGVSRIMPPPEKDGNISVFPVPLYSPAKLLSLDPDAKRARCDSAPDRGHASEAGQNRIHRRDIEDALKLMPTSRRAAAAAHEDEPR